MSGAAGVLQTNMNNIGEFVDLLSMDSITATPSGTQTTALVLTAQVSRVTTVATALDAVRLPAWAQGRAPTIINGGANTLSIFPAVGDTIDGQAVNTALSLPVGATVVFNTVTSPTTVAKAWTASVTIASDVLPLTQFTSIATGNGTLTGAQVAGAQFTTLATSGATAQTTPTAAAMLAAMPGAAIGTQWRLRFVNTNAGTLTITADASVTLTGTATIVTQAFRDFDMKILTATTASMTSVGAGTTTAQ